MVFSLGKVLMLPDVVQWARSAKGSQRSGSCKIVDWSAGCADQ